MYFEIGSPKKLASLRATLPDMASLKRNYQIAVIDDEPFARADALRAHGFNIVELGDIRSVDQIGNYGVIICDIRGVGKSLNSSLEGAHLIAEIRKSYPDKFLVSYSGAQFDISYNEALRSVDVSLTKDAPTEQWVRTLEAGIQEVSDPKRRWLRLRETLLSKGVDIHDAFVLEQSFIKAVENRDASQFDAKKLPDEAKQLALTFAKVALTQIIKIIVA